MFNLQNYDDKKKYDDKIPCTFNFEIGKQIQLVFSQSVLFSLKQNCTQYFFFVVSFVGSKL